MDVWARRGARLQVVAAVPPRRTSWSPRSVGDVQEAWGRFHERGQRARELEQLTLLT